MTVTAAALVGHAVLAKAAVSSNDVTPGVLGFLVVAGMGLALWFLLKSLSKQLRKLPPPPPDEDGETAGAKPLSPLQAAAARRRAAAAAQKSGRGSPDAPDGLG